MTDSDLSALYDRLRETEAQTREQSVQLKALAASNTALSKKVDGMMDKWDKMMDKQDKQIENMWKWLGYLLLTVIALAIGPKLAKEIVSFNTGTACVQPLYVSPDHDLYMPEEQKA